MQVVGQKADRLGGKWHALIDIQPDRSQELPGLLAGQNWQPVKGHDGKEIATTVDVTSSILWHLWERMVQ